MTTTATSSIEPAPRTARKSWLSRCCIWAVGACWLLFRIMLLAWATLVLYYSNLPWSWLRLATAVAFVAFGVWTLWWSRKAWAPWAFGGAFLIVLAWFISIPPLQHRQWRREVAVLPRAIVEGDRVRLTGFRNFEYRSRNDFTEHYEEREVLLSRLTSVDLYISYWMVGPVGHTFVSFNFDNAPPVCISIETRPEVGEGYAPIASMFKQFELIYVVGDERDLVRVRTDYRNEEVFLYPLRAPPEFARRLFLVYIDRINELAERPEWYHLLKSNCTINILRYANRAGREGRFHIGHLLNGWADHYLYESGVVDTSLPFEELRRRSRINDTARSARGAADFSQRIREGLPQTK